MKKLIIIFCALAAVALAQNPVKRDLSCQATSASSTDYTCSIASAPAAYVTGEVYRFRADLSNTAASGKPTINFNSLGASRIVKVQGGVTTALAANDIQIGQWVNLIYDGTNMQMTSQLGNAPTSSGAIVYSMAPPATLSSGATKFWCAQMGNTNDTGVACLWPVTGTITAMYCFGNPAAANTVQYTLVNNGTAQTGTADLTITGTAINGSVTGLSIAITAGQTASTRSITSASSGTVGPPRCDYLISGAH